MEDCEYVENALLAYVSSARHSKSRDEIVNTCIAFYNETDIKNAKELLYTKVKQKIIWRRSENKMKENFVDILELIEKYENENVKLPKFVTDKYNEFPPSYGFDVIAGYVQRLNDEINDLKVEVKSLKEVRTDGICGLEDIYIIKEELLEIKGLLKEMKQRIRTEDLRRDSFIVENIDKLLINQYDKCERMDYEKEVEDMLNINGNPSAPPLSQGNENVDSDADVSLLQLPSYSKVLCQTDSISKIRSKEKQRSTQPVDDAIELSTEMVNRKQQIQVQKISETQQSVRTRIQRNDRENKGSKHQVIDDEGFIEVQSRRRRNMQVSPDKQVGEKRVRQWKKTMGVQGNRNINDGKFKGLQRTVDIYLGNVDLDTECNDIIQYIKSELQVDNVKCSELVSKVLRDWKSFKVTVAMKDRDGLLQPRCWPEYVTVRKFYSSRSKTS